MVSSDTVVYLFVKYCNFFIHIHIHTLIFYAIYAYIMHILLYIKLLLWTLIPIASKFLIGLAYAVLSWSHFDVYLSVRLSIQLLLCVFWFVVGFMSPTAVSFNSHAFKLVSHNFSLSIYTVVPTLLLPLIHLSLQIIHGFVFFLCYCLYRPLLYFAVMFVSVFVFTTALNWLFHSSFNIWYWLIPYFLSVLFLFYFIGYCHW